ncbi:MAG: CehA/McbA family metallohydrolase [Bryobacterales bacterium]
MFRTVAIRAACGAAFAVALVWAQSAGLRPAHSARLRLSVKDAQSGKLTPARVYLFKGDKPFRLSPADVQLPLRVDLFYRERLWRLGSAPKTLEVTARDQSHFVLLDGEADFYLPASDDYRIEAYRGFRSKPAVAEFTLTADEDTAVKLSLEPVVGAEGWIAADDHIHLVRQPEDDEVFLKWLAAEDLAVGNFLELQRQQHAAMQYGFGEAAEARAPGYSIRSGHESRSRFYGHVLALGAREMVQPLSIGLEYANSPEAWPGPGVIFRRARELGGLSGFAHTYGSQPNSSLLMNLTHGELDFIELFQFGELHTEEWYELLNAGFRVTGLAGSDFPANIGRLIRIRARFRCWGRSVRW